MSLTLQKLFFEPDQVIDQIGASNSYPLPGTLILDRLIATILTFNHNPELFTDIDRKIIENGNFSNTYQSEIRKAIGNGLSNLRRTIIGSSDISVTPETQTPNTYTLDRIFDLSNNDIKSIALSQGQALTNDHILDRMIVTILLFNLNLLKFDPLDREIIQNPKFVNEYHTIMTNAYQTGFDKIREILAPTSNIQNDGSTPGVFIPPTIPQIGSTLMQTTFVPQSSQTFYEPANKNTVVKSRDVKKEKPLKKEPINTKHGEVLSGVALAVSGTIDGFTRKEFTDLVTNNGGVVFSSITNAVNYLVTTSDDIAKNTTKVKKAKDKSLPLVTFNFIIDSVNMGKLQDPKFYNADN